MQAAHQVNDHLSGFNLSDLKDKTAPYFWHGWTVCKIALVESITPITICVVAGLTAKYLLFACAAPPLFVLGGTLFATRIIVHLLSGIATEKVKLQIDQWNQCYPKLANIAIIASILLSFFNPLLSIVSSAATGVYLGLIDLISYHMPRHDYKQPSCLNKV
jgi:hypothetical protein